jgi:hypothetical protein
MFEQKKLCRYDLKTWQQTSTSTLCIKMMKVKNYIWFDSIFLRCFVGLLYGNLCSLTFSMANLTMGCDKWWKHVIWSSKSDNWKDNMSDNKAQEWNILYTIFHRLFSKVNLTNSKKSKTHSSNNPISKNIKKERFNQFSSRQIPFFLIKNTWTCPKYLMMRVFLQSLSDKVYKSPL